MDKIFTGFGFGPIQAGLFLSEAFKTGRFERMAVAEIDGALVDALKRANGTYSINSAHADGIEVTDVEGVELLNPADPRDLKELRGVLAESTEIATSLPSVAVYSAGGGRSVAKLLADALCSSKGSGTIVYTAENNNRAAELLHEAVERVSGPEGMVQEDRVQLLNTVIGKMSSLVTDPEEIKRLDLKPLVPGLQRAFLVESFNRIFVTRCTLEGFRPGIDVFIEKEDLLPFEEAKLYGHNAIHFLLACLARLRGYRLMKEVKADDALMTTARRAFVDESGGALVKKYAHLDDPLFTEAGYKAYALDLLERMTCPFLNDTVRRAARDLERKLGPDDRVFGTMRVVLEQEGIMPENMAMGAAAALACCVLDGIQTGREDGGLRGNWKALTGDAIHRMILKLWGRSGDSLDAVETEMIDLVKAGKERLARMV